MQCRAYIYFPLLFNVLVSFEILEENKEKEGFACFSSFISRDSQLVTCATSPKPVYESAEMVSPVEDENSILENPTKYNVLHCLATKQSARSSLPLLLLRIS